MHVIQEGEFPGVCFTCVFLHMWVSIAKLTRCRWKLKVYRYVQMKYWHIWNILLAKDKSHNLWKVNFFCRWSSIITKNVIIFGYYLKILGLQSQNFNFFPQIQKVDIPNPTPTVNTCSTVVTFMLQHSKLTQ